MSRPRHIRLAAVGAALVGVAATLAVAWAVTPERSGAVVYLEYDASGFAQTYVACRDM